MSRPGPDTRRLVAALQATLGVTRDRVSLWRVAPRQGRGPEVDVERRLAGPRGGTHLVVSWTPCADGRVWAARWGRMHLRDATELTYRLCAAWGRDPEPAD